MDKENKKLLIISIIGVALFITAITSVSYAFYTSTVKHDNKGVSAETTTKKISYKFEDGEEKLNVTNMVPGDTFKKSFTLKNTGTAPVNFRIVVKDLENTFTRKEDIQYQIKKGESEEQTIGTGDWKPFPDSSNGGASALSEKLTLETDTQETGDKYTIYIRYENKETEDQSTDMSATISGKIFIEEYDGEDE